MSNQNAEVVSVRILPNTEGKPPGKLADAEVIFEAEAGPLSGLKLIGFAIWERRSGNGRNVTFPARQYLRQRRTSEFRVAAPHEWGCQRAGGGSGSDSRGVQRQRGPDRLTSWIRPEGWHHASLRVSGDRPTQKASGAGWGRHPERKFDGEHTT